MKAATLEDLPPDKPVVLLDVDGVLNPLLREKPTTWPDFRQVHANGFELWLSPEMGAALAALPATVVWSTTWCDEPTHLERFTEHLGGLAPVWLGRWGRSRDLRWKRELAYAAAERFPAVVWVDDLERWPPFTATPKHVLGMHPAPAEGLTRDDVGYIADWLADRVPKVAPSEEPAEVWRRAHAQPFSDVVDQLRALLTPTLVAYIAGVGGTRVTAAWAEGQGEPPHPATQLQLRAALHAALIVSSAYDEDTAQSWMQAVDSPLDGCSPATALRESHSIDELRAVALAAQRFAAQ